MERRLNDRVSVSGQISPDILVVIKNAGFDVIVDGRPDNEVPQAASSEVMREAAEKAGLHFHYIPMTPGALPSKAEAQAFAKATEQGRVFAYCGGGPRVIALASFAAASQGRPVSEIIDEARGAGISLDQARTLLVDRGASDS